MWQRETSEQLAQSSAAFRNDRVRIVIVCGAAALTSGCSSDGSPASLPKYWPFDATMGPPGPSVAIRSHIENSSSGAFGAHACQAATIFAASLQLQVAVYVTTSLAGCVANRKPVTISNCPAPPPRQAPEEIRMLSRVREQQLPARGHDLQGQHVVAGEAPGAAGEPVTATERQTGDPDGRTRAFGDGDAFQREPLHHVDQAGARTDRRGAVSVVDADSAHPREVDDNTTARRVARVAVPAGPRDDSDRVTPRPAHGPPDVLR